MIIATAFVARSLVFIHTQSLCHERYTAVKESDVEPSILANWFRTFNTFFLAKT